MERTRLTLILGSGAAAVTTGVLATHWLALALGVVEHHLCCAVFAAEVVVHGRGVFASEQTNHVGLVRVVSEVVGHPIVN